MERGASVAVALTTPVASALVVKVPLGSGCAVAGALVPLCAWIGWFGWIGAPAEKLSVTGSFDSQPEPWSWKGAPACGNAVPLIPSVGCAVRVKSAFAAIVLSGV